MAGPLGSSLDVVTFALSDVALEDVWTISSRMWKRKIVKYLGQFIKTF